MLPCRRVCRPPLGALPSTAPPSLPGRQVDATQKENEAAKGKFKIQGFPTIKARGWGRQLAGGSVCGWLAGGGRRSEPPGAEGD